MYLKFCFKRWYLPQKAPWFHIWKQIPQFLIVQETLLQVSLNSGVLLSFKIVWQSLSSTGLGFLSQLRASQCSLYSSLGCFKDAKRAEGDLWELPWHFSITANSIRKVMNCHWRFWYLLIKKTICKQYL